jgi:hypothetical protein
MLAAGGRSLNHRNENEDYLGFSHEKFDPSATLAQ